MSTFLHLSDCVKNMSISSVNAMQYYGQSICKFILDQFDLVRMKSRSNWKSSFLEISDILFLFQNITPNVDLAKPEYASWNFMWSITMKLGVNDKVKVTAAIKIWRNWKYSLAQCGLAASRLFEISWIPVSLIQSYVFYHRGLWENCQWYLLTPKWPYFEHTKYELLYNKI